MDTEVVELEMRSFEGGHESEVDDANEIDAPQAEGTSKSNNVNAGLAVAFCAIFGCLLRECFAVMTASFNVTGPCAGGSADLSVGFDFGGTTASTVWLALGAKFFVPNCLGCFIMGILYGLKKQGKVGARWSTLVGGLGTGFCGSLTTFSTWMAVSGEVLIGGSWLDWVNLVVLNLMLYMAFWDLGFEAVNGIAANSLRRRGGGGGGGGVVGGAARGAASRTESARSIDRERPASPSTEAAGFAAALVCAWVGVVVLAVFHETWRVQWFSCALAPFGALARWGLGKFNVAPRDKDSTSSRNFQADYFPLFTAVANLIGTLVRSLLGVGCLYVLNSESCSDKELLSVVSIVALQSGFCGSLSTVSTFVTELKQIRLREKFEQDQYSSAAAAEDLSAGSTDTITENAAPAPIPFVGPVSDLLGVGGAFRYGALSIVIAQVLVLLTTGMAVWWA